MISVTFSYDELLEQWTMSVKGEEVGTAAGMTRNQALDAFATNWSELAAELDGLRDPAEAAQEKPQRAARTVSSGKARLGSGARFRALMMAGASNAEALAAVRLEFPDSKAGLSDAAWNRRELTLYAHNTDGSRCAAYKKQRGPAGAEPLVDDLL